MRSLFFSRSATVGYHFLIASLASGLLFFFTSPSFEGHVRSAAHALNTPVLGLARFLVSAVTYTEEKMASQKKLIAINHELRKKLLEAELKQQELQRLKLANHEYRRFFNLYPRDSLHSIYATVFSFNNNLNYSRLYLNKGYNQGVRTGYIVFSRLGLLGRIVSLSNQTSKVMTLIDARHKLPAMVRTPKQTIHLIASGTGSAEFLEAHLIIGEYLLKKGDKVYTSGLGGAYPRGFLIGKILSLESDTRNQNLIVRIKPVNHFTDFRYVAIQSHQVTKPASFH